MKNRKLVKIGYWVTRAGFDLKRPGAYPLSPSSLKILLKNTALEYVYYLAKFHGLMWYGSKDIFKSIPFRMLIMMTLKMYPFVCLSS